MKIKSIKKVGPELFLIKYKGFHKKERHVIRSDKPLEDSFAFYFRDNNDHVGSCDGRDILRWMVRNKIDNFSNKEV